MSAFIRQAVKNRGQSISVFDHEGTHKSSHDMIRRLISEVNNDYFRVSPSSICYMGNFSNLNDGNIECVIAEFKFAVRKLLSYGFNMNNIEEILNTVIDEEKTTKIMTV